MQVPKFIKGQTLAFAMTLPDEVSEDQFKNWTLSSQLRRYQDRSPEGLIADLVCKWADEDKFKVITFYHNVTDNWPVGLAEFDVVLTSPQGQKVRTHPVVIYIQGGITQ